MDHSKVEKIEFDLCVVGSGAGGGVTARTLSESGAKVCILEIGEWKDPGKDFRGHIWPFELPRRGLQQEHSSHLFGNPAIYSSTSAGSELAPYLILPAVGGKTLLWAGHSWRFGPRDFRLHASHGVGVDWPISYEDLAPYYDEVETFMGVSGTRDGLEVIPDGNFLPPLNFRCGELQIGRALSHLGPHFKMISARKAINTVPHRGRAACHYCGHCMKGCEVDAKYTSANSEIPAALKTGNATLVTSAMAIEILLDGSGNRVSGVVYRDLKTQQEKRVRCKALALACGPIETTRLLLLSRSKLFPQGLANNSGNVGRNLQSTVECTTLGYLKSLKGSKAVNDDGTDSFHGTVPNPYYHKPHPDFPNGYLINVGSGAQIPYSSGALELHSMEKLPGFGKTHKQKLRNLVPALVTLGCQGQTLEANSNFVDLDPKLRDGFGFPAIRLHFSFGESEQAMIRDMRKVTRALIEAAGGVVINPDAPGAVDPTHYVGTCRMGTDADHSVLNPYCQSHDLRNLFIVDGSSFPSYPEKNPTESVIAVSLRAATFLGDQLRKGNL